MGFRDEDGKAGVDICSVRRDVLSRISKSEPGSGLRKYSLLKDFGSRSRQVGGDFGDVLANFLHLVLASLGNHVPCHGLGREQR